MRKHSRIERVVLFGGLWLVVSALVFTALGRECRAQGSELDRGGLAGVLKGRVETKDAWQSLPPAEEIERQTQQILSEPLTLDGALRIALLNHAGLRAEVQQLSVAQAIAYQKTVFLNPTLDGSIQFSDGSVGKIEAALLFDLVPLFYVGIERSLARSEVEVARLKAGATVISFLEQVYIAYFDTVANGQLLTVIQNDVAAMQALVRSAELLFESGNLTPYELSTQRVRAVDVQTTLLDARSVWQTSRRRLQELLGIDGAQEWSVPATLPEFVAPSLDSEALKKRVVAQSLRLQSLRHDQDFSRTHIRLNAWQGWLPTLQVGVSGEADFGQTNQYFIGPAIHIQIPLFGAPVEFEAKIVQAELEFRAEQRALELKVSELHEKIQLAVERIEHLRNYVLPLRAQVLEQAQLQFNASAIDLFELLSMRQMQLQAQRDYIAALRDGWLLSAQIETLLAGGKLEEKPSAASNR